MSISASLLLQLSSANLQIWNIFTTWVSASGITNLWASRTPWFQQAQPNYNPQTHWVFLLPSLSPLQCISLVSALQRWTKLGLCWPAPHCASGRGKHHVTGSEWACFLFCPCSKSKKNRINKVFTKENEVNSTILRMKLNRQYHPSTGDQSFLWISVEVSISSSSIISLSQNFAMLKIVF